jgi:hypothetical protein
MSSKLTRQMDSAMRNIQGQQLAPEMTAAYQQAMQMGRQGMSDTSQQLAIQNQNRGISAMFRNASAQRGRLASMGGLSSSMNDFSLGLAKQNEDLMREGQKLGIQTGMQVGEAQNELTRYKNEAAYNELAAKKERRAKMLNGIVGAVGSIAGAALTGGLSAGGAFTKAGAASDIRLKDNITLIGKSESGLNIYTFGYKGQEGLYEGVMAQDLLGTNNNNAVFTMDNGMYAVDYSNLDVQFKRLN